MNCTHYQKQILLQASGELRSRDALAEHLKACADCRAFADAEQRLAQLARENLPDADPHPASMVAIRQAAEARHRSNIVWFPAPLTRVAAYAALLMLIAGGTLWITGIPTRQHADRVSELSTMVAMVSDTLAGNDATVMRIVDDSNLKAVARQLLEMEGFAVDDLFDDEEAFTRSEQPDPTTTQWRKTHGLPAETCV